MTHDELTRAAAAVPVAALFGLLFGRGVRSRLAAGLLGGALTLLALANHLDSWRSWLVGAIAAVAASLMPGRGDVARRWRREHLAGRPGRGWRAPAGTSDGWSGRCCTG